MQIIDRFCSKLISLNVSDIFRFLFRCFLFEKTTVWQLSFHVRLILTQDLLVAWYFLHHFQRFNSFQIFHGCIYTFWKLSITSSECVQRFRLGPKEDVASFEEKVEVTLVKSAQYLYLYNLLWIRCLRPYCSVLLLPIFDFFIVLGFFDEGLPWTRLNFWGPNCLSTFFLNPKVPELYLFSISLRLF